MIDVPSDPIVGDTSTPVTPAPVVVTPEPAPASTSVSLLDRIRFYIANDPYVVGAVGIVLLIILLLAFS